MGTIVEFPERGAAAKIEKLSEWKCPLCRQEMNLLEFKSKPGFLLVCKGSDAIPHRLRIYLENFSKDASFLPGSMQSKKARVQQLLERVKAGA